MCGRRLDLGAMHQPALARIEAVTPMQRAAVVPKNHVTFAPFLAKGELRLRCMRPERIEQRFALIERHSQYIAIAPTSQEESRSAGFRMHSHERVVRARRLARIRNFLVPLAHLSGAVIG